MFDGGQFDVPMVISEEEDSSVDRQESDLPGPDRDLRGSLKRRVPAQPAQMRRRPAPVEYVQADPQYEMRMPYRQMRDPNEVNALYEKIRVLETYAVDVKTVLTLRNNQISELMKIISSLDEQIEDMSKYMSTMVGSSNRPQGIWPYFPF